MNIFNPVQKKINHRRIDNIHSHFGKKHVKHHITDNAVDTSDIITLPSDKQATTSAFVNHMPMDGKTGARNERVGNYGKEYSLDYFDFADQNGNKLKAFIVTKLDVGAGSLTIDGLPVYEGQVIPADKIHSIKWHSATPASGTFQFLGQDGTFNFWFKTMVALQTAVLIPIQTP